MLKESFQKDTITKYALSKCTILDVIFLLVAFVFLAAIFVGHQGSLVIDCGREAYIPSEVLKGKILYKDIFNIYGPFAYQLNAFLYKIFGENLQTLYNAGLVNSGIILSSIFLISRQLTKSSISTAVTFFVMVTCVFNLFIFNYIFPYSYAMSYALCGFLLSALFLILYSKTSKENFVPISAFFAGISMASKYEYLAYFVFLALYIAFIKPVSRKNLFYSLVSFLAVPLICFGTLFDQGLRIDDLLNSFFVVKKMLSTETLNFFYSNFIGLYPNIPLLFASLIKFFTTVFYFLFFTVFVYVVKAIKKYKFSNSVKMKIVRWLIIVFILLGLWGYTGFLFNKITDYNLFSWMPLTNLFLLIGFVVYYIKIAGIKQVFNRDFLKSFIKSIELRDKIFMLTLTLAFLASLKSLFFLNINVYGSFILPLVLITNFVFVAEYVPRLLIFLDREIWRKSIAIVLVVISFLFCLKNLNSLINFKSNEIKTPKGTIFTLKDDYVANVSVLNYINKKTKKTDKILILPEGPMLNFLSGRPSDDIYNSLIPLYVETFGEDKIIKDLSKNSPELIIINNRNSSDYGYPYFCKDYAHKICSFINNNYVYKGQYGDNFVMVVFKKK